MAGQPGSCPPSFGHLLHIYLVPSLLPNAVGTITERQARSSLQGDLLNASVSGREVLLRTHLDYEGCLTVVQATCGDKPFHSPSLSMKRGQGQSRQCLQKELSPLDDRN